MRCTFLIMLLLSLSAPAQDKVDWSGNASAGYGTDGRYTSGMSLRRGTSLSNVSLFGGVNNINEGGTPGEFSPEMLHGEQKTSLFGMDYRVSDKVQRWNVGGNAVVKFADIYGSTASFRENFLPGTSSYERINNTTTRDEFSVTTKHTIKYFKRGFQFQLTPQLSYSRNNILGELSQTDSLSGIRINRVEENGCYMSTAFTAGTNYKMFVSLDNKDNRIYLDGGAHYRKRTDEDHIQYMLDYCRADMMSDYRNRRGNKPAEHFDMNVKIRPVIGRWQIMEMSTKLYFSTVYEYRYRHDNEDVSRYRFDHISDWAVDAANSYVENTREHQHRVEADLEFGKYNFGRNKDMGFEAHLLLPVTLVNENTHHSRASFNQRLHRNVVLFNPNLDIAFDYNRNEVGAWSIGNRGLHFNYNIKQELPSHSLMVDAGDDTNPLYITYGNPDLEKTVKHNLSLDFYKNPSWGRSVSASLSYSKVNNAVVMGMVYDRTTGVRRITPANVDGNWNTKAALGFSLPLDEKRKWRFRSDANSDFCHNVGIVGIDDEAVDYRHAVNVWSVGESVGLDYHPNNKAYFGLKSHVSLLNANSGAENFRDLDAVDFNFTFTTRLTLPYQITLRTDITYYGRNGYNYRCMNDDEIVWNANLSRSFLKDKLQVSINAKDILGQRSYIRRTIDAQSLTETQGNVLPRYLMLTATYKFSKQYKKK